MLLRVVPAEAVTTPRMVTVHEPQPSMLPALQVTRLTFCVQLPRVLVSTSCGGTPMPPTPFTWLARLTLVSFAPPVLVMVVV